MNRIIAAVALIATFVQPATALAVAGGPTLIAQSSVSSVGINGQFTVTVQMDTKSHQVTAAELHMTYPANRLQALSVQPGTFLPSVLTAGATGSGTASITVGSGTAPKQGTGSVMVVTFRALAPGSAQIAFASNTQVAASGSNVVDTMTPTTVTVMSGTATPTASVTPVPTLLFTPTPTPVIGGATLTVQASQASVATNGQFTVTVQLDTKANQVTATELHLTYPANRLQALSVQPGIFLPTVLTAGAVGPGTASIRVGSGASPKQGAGPIAIVTFRALSPGSAQIGFAGNSQVSVVGQTGNALGVVAGTTVSVVSAASQAGGVATGPFQSGLVALVASIIATLAYVGYIRTDQFKRREIQAIAAQEQNHPPDFMR